MSDRVGNKDGVTQYRGRTPIEKIKTFGAKAGEKLSPTRRDDDAVPSSTPKIKHSDPPYSAPTRRTGTKSSVKGSQSHHDHSAPTDREIRRIRRPGGALLPYPRGQESDQSHFNIPLLTIPQGGVESLTEKDQPIILDEAPIVLPSKNKPLTKTLDLPSLMSHIGVEEHIVVALQAKKEWGALLEATAAGFVVKECTVGGKPVLKILKPPKEVVAEVAWFLMRNTQHSAACQFLAMCPALKRHVLLGELVGSVNGFAQGGVAVMSSSDERLLSKLLNRTAVDLISKDRRDDFVNLMNACDRDQRETVLATLMFEPTISRSVMGQLITRIKNQEKHTITHQGIYKKAVQALPTLASPMKGLILLAQVSAELRGTYFKKIGRGVKEYNPEDAVLAACKDLNLTEADSSFIKNILNKAPGFTNEDAEMPPQMVLPAGGRVQEIPLELNVAKGLELSAEPPGFAGALILLSSAGLRKALLESLGAKEAVEVLWKALDANKSGEGARTVVANELQGRVSNPVTEDAVKARIIEVVNDTLLQEMPRARLEPV